MNRREFAQGAGMMLAGSYVAAPGESAEKPAARAVLELRVIRMRTSHDNQLQRTSEYLETAFLPALQRAGAGPFGFFASVIAPESPFILTVTQFPSVGAWESVREKAAQDPEYQKAREAYNNAPSPAYERMDVTLLRCFSSIPAIELPGARSGGSRIFELRTYESNNGSTLERKIRMFNEGEIAIFRRVGMKPIFFGETIIGDNMPNLVYMLGFDNLASREAAWNSFGSDPGWKEISSKPGNVDAELVSNISNAILRPLPFSPIR